MRTSNCTIHVEVALSQGDLTRLLAIAADERKNLADVVTDALRAYDAQRREHETEAYRSLWSLGGTRSVPANRPRPSLARQPKPGKRRG